MKRVGVLRNERGVSLVLVLVTLVIFGLIVPVLGQFGSTNGVSGYVLKGQRFDRYAAEAGMQGAIQWAQGQRQAGRQGTKCPDITTGNLNDTAGVNASRSVTVQCAGFDGNGQPAGTDTIPQFAVLALGTGRAISLSGGGKLRTAGAWWSNGSIDPGNVTLDATADSIGAHDGCAGINASPCDPTHGGHVDDPDIPIEIPSVIPVDRPGPTDACDAAPNGVMTLQPGLHWDSATLDEIGDGNCGDVTIHLAAGGPHIFDFQFFGGGRPDWKLVPASLHHTVRIVSDGWSPTGCTPGRDDPVLFAGTFRMQVGNGATVDVCGADEAHQRVSIAQVIHGTPPHNELSGSRTTPSGWTVGVRNGSFDFPQSSPATPASLLADSECDPDSNCTGGFVEGRVRGDRAVADVQLTVPDPNPTNVGLKMDHLHLDITHRESGGNDIQQVRVFISDGLPERFQSECDLSRSGEDVPQSGSWNTKGFDCALNDVHLPYFKAGDLKITYEVQLKNRGNGDNPPERSATIGLDAVQLTSVFARSTAQTSHPSGNVLQIDSGAALHTDGTVDLPTGALNIDFGQTTSTTFGRGVIAKTLVASRLPSAEDFIPFSLPNGGTYTNRLATFRAFLGSDTSDPSTAVLTARVRFCDAHLDGAPLDATPDECPDIAFSPAKILAWDPKR